MHPILLQIGPLTLRTYGALIALAFLASLQVLKRAFRIKGLPENAVMDLVTLFIFSGLLGARLFYVLVNGAYFMQHPWESLKIWEGGLVFYGGFLAAAAAGIIYVRRHHLPLAAVADGTAPALALGQAIGRWGCYFAGCCYGRPTTLPWGIQFKDPASLAPPGISLHPTQIYEAMGDLAIFVFLWMRLVRKPAPPGSVFWLYVLLYGLLRFGLEFLRGDDRGPAPGGFYPSQWIALAAVLVGGSFLMAQSVARKENTHESISHH